ncbi:MAG: hypothetical protein DRI34_03425 [Deltaproteobacteria bacterium]|nr:MAG: hypothetical protein DRI34_03425 [Deltaproteobacteria bacterium]
MGEKFGKYELVRKIAVGGMAEIFLATHTGPEGFKKHVAIKRILPHLTEDSDFVTMFLDEARLVARFSHPNLVQIFELGQVRNVYFLAMEYVNGASMSRVLKTCRKNDIPFPAEYGVKICSFACEGLEYAHNFTDPDGTPLNLIHRDVSPQNLMLSYDGVVKVLDFGIAKAAGNLYRTRTTSLKGKAAYMSPEQITQKTGLDRRSDIFALGIVLYEFTTGRRPFEGDTELELMMGIVQSEATDPRQFAPDMPAELAGIIMTALKKDRRQRYQSAREMRAALEQYLLHQQKMVDSYELSSFARQVLPPDETPVGYSVPTPSHPSLADQIEEALQAAQEGKAPVPAAADSRRTPTGQRPVPEPGLGGRTGSRPIDVPIRAPEDAPTMLTPSEVLRPLLDTEPPTDKDEPVRPPAAARLKVFAVAGLLVLVAVAGALAAYLSIDSGSEDGDDARVAAASGQQAADAGSVNVVASAAERRPEGAEDGGRPARSGGARADAGAVAAAADAGPQSAPDAGAAATVAVVERPPEKPRSNGKQARHKVRKPARNRHRKPKPRRPATPPVKKSEEKKVAARAPAAQGSLLVQSHPWTNVKVDGVSLGATPWEGPTKLKAGVHVVQLSNPDGILYREKVNIRPGKTFTLRKRFRKGFLKVFVKPFGEVYVNGSRKGVTPLGGPLELYEGRHRLRVYCPRTGKEFTKRLTIRPGDTVVEKIDLR